MVLSDRSVISKVNIIDSNIVFFSSGSATIRNRLVVHGTVYYVRPGYEIDPRIIEKATVWKDVDLIMDEMTALDDLYVCSSARLICEGITDYRNSQVLGDVPVVDPVEHPRKSILAKMYYRIWTTLFKILWQIAPLEATEFLTDLL